MTLGFLMVVLTFLDNGQLSAAFVNTQTLQECEKRASVVRGILEKGDVTIERLVCRSSQAQFEPFVHGMEDDRAERQAYRISFDEKTVTVSAVASCEADGVPGEGVSYCAASTQKLISQPQ